MRATITQIIDRIPRAHIFDSHYVITCLIEEFSDRYLDFASTFNATSDRTLVVHGNIGKAIATLEGISIERVEHESWSRNIHGNDSPCTCWRKL